MNVAQSEPFILIHSRLLSPQEKNFVPWILWAISFRGAFGVLDSSDKREFRQKLNKLHTLAENQSESIIFLKNSLASLAAVTSTKDRRLATAIRGTQQDLVKMQSILTQMSTKLIEMTSDVDQDFAILSQFLVTLLRGVETADLVAELSQMARNQASDIRSLQEGHIPATLVPYKNMRAMLFKISKQLQKSQPGLRLIHQSVSAYYRQVPFEVHRTNNMLLLLMYIPMATGAGILHLYSSQLLPVPVQQTNLKTPTKDGGRHSGDIGLVKIHVDKTLLAISHDERFYTDLTPEDLLQCDQTGGWYVCPHIMGLRRPADPICLYALFRETCLKPSGNVPCHFQ